MQTQENNSVILVSEEPSIQGKIIENKMEQENKETNKQEINENRINTKTDYIYAGFFTRVAAFCIDSVLVGVLLLAVRIPMLIDMISGEGILNSQVLFEFTGWDVIIYLLTSFYYIFLTYHSGATIGKRLLRIRVISINGENLSFMDIFYRETIGKFLSGVAMNMGYVLIGIDKEKRGFHDMLSDTRVVYDWEGSQKKQNEKQITEKNGVTTVSNNYEWMTKEQKMDKKRIAPPSNYGYVPGSQKVTQEREMTVAEKGMENPLNENKSTESEMILDEKKE